MSEEIKKNDLIDDVEDKEEYERALAALNKSKSARVKKIVDEKKAKKQKEKEAQKKSSSGSSDDKSFIGKCKKDPVIPACILLIIIAAIGQPDFVTAYMVKEGAVIVDVGTTRVPDATKKSGFRLNGDVKFDEVAPKCSFITPVPGGVGPMTICSLMKNTLAAGKKEYYK